MRRLNRDDQGSVTLFFVLMMPLLLLFAALVLDGGRGVVANRIAQNEADAAALAKAADCAFPPTIATPTLLAPYMPRTVLDPEKPAPTCGANSTTVYTAKTVTRAFSIGPSTAHRSATATWGRFSLATSVPLAISICDFQTHPIEFHGGAHCGRGPSGQDVAGGFGWLDNSSTCTATRNADGTYGGDTGRPDKTGCNWKSFVDNQTEISIVVFNKVVETGSHAKYTVAGFAHYVIKGYSFQITGPHSWPDAYGTLAGGCPGGSSVDCVDGVFKGFTQSQGDLLPGPCNAVAGDTFGCKVYLTA